jgi:hypothetical protein
MLTRSLAKRLGPEVRVNGIAPGPILWPSGQAQDQAKRDKIIERTILKRMGSPEDIARTALFFAADAPYVTGQILRSTAAAAWRGNGGNGDISRFLANGTDLQRCGGGGVDCSLRERLRLARFKKFPGKEIFGVRIVARLARWSCQRSKG